MFMWFWTIFSLGAPVETHCNLHLSLELNLYGDEIEMSCPSSTQQTSNKKEKIYMKLFSPKTN